MKMPKDILEKINDTELWDCFRRGDEGALEQLMKMHFRKLFHYGTKFSKDGAFVKDCIQDLFLDLWNRRQFLSEVQTVKAYLMAALRRRLHRGMTKKGYFVTEEITSDVFFEVEFSVEDSLIQEETTQLLAHEIKNYLDQLPKRQKEVIYLRFFEGLTREEIAEIMGINLQSVSNLLQSAFKHLKENWKTELFLFVLLSIIH
ncbi:sigma-70 family RNA polymerase sigma factor [Cytophagaceae bacterium DM2B3-1]|uniref:Sigma-70 family RNA polymerase sigma factor n=1 Tax=Xanthocytophaga flava TaxID=3048013 RepID=A0ABT7CJW8_9BACT|nr:sigma-70 family RNA polymerase sigma factor [Xanthocytophaga flavus]MDJ1494042.1 sigma-70 family RNA polymerase sigma factor [Xanthocytophaga flavus]